MTIEERLDELQPRHRDHLFSKCPQCVSGTLKLKYTIAGVALNSLICSNCKFECEREMSKKRYLEL